MSLSFTIASDPRQRSHFQVRDLRDLWPNFAVSDSSFPQPGESSPRIYLKPQSESYVTTDGQSASLSWNKAPIWGMRLDFYYCQTVAGLLMWGALSLWLEDRSVVYNCCWPSPAQSFSDRVQWDSRPYFTVSDSRLSFRRLLRFAGLRWRYSTLPPYGIISFFWSLKFLHVIF
jgi:hypothetical protein